MIGPLVAARRDHLAQPVGEEPLHGHGRRRLRDALRGIDPHLEHLLAHLGLGATVDCPSTTVVLDLAAVALAILAPVDRALAVAAPGITGPCHRCPPSADRSIVLAVYSIQRDFLAV